MRRYHHPGIPTTESLPGEVLLEHLEVFVSGCRKSPYNIEWIRYEEDAPSPEIVKTLPHVAFEVDGLDHELQGKKVIIPPNSPGGGVAFVEDNGAPVEFAQIAPDVTGQQAVEPAPE